jgi:hypothetical protein
MEAIHYCKVLVPTYKTTFDIFTIIRTLDFKMHIL